jgi:hypothetical protein
MLFFVNNASKIGKIHILKYVIFVKNNLKYHVANNAMPNLKLLRILTLNVNYIIYI